MQIEQPTEVASPARRRFLGMLLGGGLFASALSFVYPVLRYLVPPRLTDAYVLLTARSVTGPN